jgi:hypothetical protein
MKKGIVVRVAVLAVAVGAVVSFASPSLAQKKFLERIRKHYQLDRTNGQCALCHDIKPREEAGRKNLNKFGTAIQTHADMKPLLGKDDEYKFSDKELETFEKVLVALENDDSDGDGVSNKEELDLGTFPGDPKSVPEKAKLEKYRKDHPVAKK